MREFYTATVMRVNRKTGDTTWVDQRKVRSLQRRFIGDMVTETGRAPRLYNEAGYVDVYNGGDSVCYYYYERDHLGSVRAVVDESGAAVQTAGYYASGIPVVGSLILSDDRLHTGKQWQQFGGLAWYDNRARWYDPVLARFTTPDPLQEKYPHLSPYTHCANNPYKFVDLNGDSIALLGYNGEHSALLIQAPSANGSLKWHYFSFNGTSIFNSTSGKLGGSPYNNLGLNSFDNVNDFFLKKFPRASVPICVRRWGLKTT